MKIIRMDGNPWRSREEMANALGVTVRTITRMVTRGELVRKQTKTGMLYQFPIESQELFEDGDVSQDRTGQDTSQDSPESNARQLTGHETGQGQGVLLDSSDVEDTNNHGAKERDRLIEELRALRQEREEWLVERGVLEERAKMISRQLQQTNLQLSRVRTDLEEARLRMAKVESEKDLYRRLYEKHTRWGILSILKRLGDYLFR